MTAMEEEIEIIENDYASGQISLEERNRRIGEMESQAKCE